MEIVNHLMLRQCEGCRCKERGGFKLDNLGKEKCYSTSREHRRENWMKLVDEIGELKTFIWGLKRLRFNSEIWQT